MYRGHLVEIVEARSSDDFVSYVVRINRKQVTSRHSEHAASNFAYYAIDKGLASREQEDRLREIEETRVEMHGPGFDPKYDAEGDEVWIFQNGVWRRGIVHKFRVKSIDVAYLMGGKPHLTKVSIDKVVMAI